MTNSINIRRLPLNLINVEDRTYRLLPFDNEPPHEQFISHVKRCGILHPPIVKEEKSGPIVIVAGRKRLQVAQNNLGLTSCDCIIISPDKNELETLTFALEEALIKAPLSAIEKACFFRKVLKFINEIEAARRFLPLLGSGPHPYNIKKLLPLTVLEEPIAKATHTGSLSEHSALELAQLSFRDRFALFDLIATLKLSVGNQKKFIMLCQDLAKRDSSSILGVIGTQEINDIVNHPEANPPQKSGKIMNLLQQKASPQITEAKKDFKNTISQLKLPDWAEAQHSPNFEKDQMLLTLKLANLEELKKYWQHLTDIST